MSCLVLRKLSLIRFMEPIRLLESTLSNSDLKCLPSVGHFQNKTHVFASTVATATASEDEPHVKHISEMPGPRSYPFIGSALSLLLRKDFDTKRLHIMFQNMIKEYGPVFKLEIQGEPTMVAVTRPDDIEKMYRVTMENPVREAFHSLKKVRYEAIDNYFEKKGGILTENNEEWWRVRSRVQTPMMKPKNLIKYLPLMDEVTLNFMDRISDFQKEFGEMPSNFQEELYKWALESVALVALNRRLGCLEPNLSPNSHQMELINTVNGLFEALNNLELGIPFWRLFPTSSYRKLKKSHDIFVKMADSHIRETEAELIGKKNLEKEGDEHEMTLLEALLRRDGLTRIDVVTMILDMLFAGIDTTSHSLAFTLYLLAKNQGVQQRLHEELDSVLGTGEGFITESHLARLSYLKLCVKESFRVFPLVFGSARVLQADGVFSGYLVPKGYTITSLNVLTCKDESVFPRATEFIPERWGRDQPLGPIHPFASLPFSHGPRMCIGRRIAEQEMYTFLARVMHRFHVDYKYKDMDFHTRLVSVPSEPLRFKFTERK